MTARHLGREKRRFSVDDYHRMGESGIIGPDERTELLDGEIYYMTPMGSRHAAHVAQFAKVFERKFGDDYLVWVQNPLRLGTDSEPEPDLAVLEDRADRYASALPGADDTRLVVEIADTSLEFDRSTKVPLYARHRVPVVWLVDLEGETLEVYDDPNDGEYASHEEFVPGDTVRIPSLTATLDVGDLFVE